MDEPIIFRYAIKVDGEALCTGPWDDANGHYILAQMRNYKEINPASRITAEITYMTDAVVSDFGMTAQADEVVHATVDTLYGDDYRVELAYIGEGRCEDYDHTDPGDVPLLRFTVQRYDNRTYDWEPVEDGSWCTRLDARISTEAKQKWAAFILGLCWSALYYEQGLSHATSLASNLEDSP